jgi:hypothetical protein
MAPAIVVGLAGPTVSENPFRIPKRAVSEVVTVCLVMVVVVCLMRSEAQIDGERQVRGWGIGFKGPSRLIQIAVSWKPRK